MNKSEIKQIAVLEAELQARKKFDLPLVTLRSELGVLNPGLQKTLLSLVDDEGKIVLIGSLSHTGKLRPAEKATLMEWLRVRTKADHVRISFEETKKTPIASVDKKP